MGAPAKVRALWMTPWITSPGLSVALSDQECHHLWALDAMVRGQPDHFGPSTAVRHWRFVGGYLISDAGDVFDSEGQRMPAGFLPAGDETVVETYYNGRLRFSYHPSERDQFLD